MPQPVQTAEKIFGATEAELTAQAQPVVGDTPILAAGAFWPNGVTQEMIEDGTLRGRKFGAMFGPSMNQMFALWGAFAGAEMDPADYEMAKPLIVAVTGAEIHIIEPAIGDTPPTTVRTFARATTSVKIKRRGINRIVLLDDDVAASHFRLLASVAPYMKRSGPEKAVMAELTRAE